MFILANSVDPVDIPQSESYFVKANNKGEVESLHLWRLV